jgi:hypothetical protein
MAIDKARIARFFDRYAARFNRSLQDPPVVDTAGVIDAFADYFVEASPRGVQGGKNGLRFRLVVPWGFAHYRKLGTTSMTIKRLSTTAIDDRHAMARVTWDSRYTRPRDGKAVRIVFTNVYFLQVLRGKPRIFAYVTGDEAGLLKKHGLG